MNYIVEVSTNMIVWILLPLLFGMAGMMFMHKMMSKGHFAMVKAYLDDLFWTEEDHR